LLRATMGGDREVVEALLDKGASPNINDMGVTSFLVAAGVGPGSRGGTGLAAATSVGGPVNRDLMELLLAHGADVNAQVTGTFTYSMRVARAPSANEGTTALHVAAQSGRVDIVRYLLEKGARTDIADAEGHKPADLVGVRFEGETGPGVDPATQAGIRATLLEGRRERQSQPDIR
jgi:ankyrin repeat protein